MDSTSEVALSSVPLQLSSCKDTWESIHSLSQYEAGLQMRFLMKLILQWQKFSQIKSFEKLTSSCSLLQLFSWSFKSCRSFTACRLAMVIFLSVSLLLFLWVSSKCFLSVMVAFLSLMFWLAWASCWLQERPRQETQTLVYSSLPFSVHPHSQTFPCLSLSQHVFYQQRCKVKDFTSAHCCISASRCFICLIVFSHWWMTCCVSRWACCKFSVVLSKAICWEDRRKMFSHRRCDNLWLNVSHGSDIQEQHDPNPNLYLSN